jgi:hypothetical protein
MFPSLAPLLTLKELLADAPAATDDTGDDTRIPSRDSK